MKGRMEAVVHMTEAADAANEVDQPNAEDATIATEALAAAEITAAPAAVVAEGASALHSGRKTQHASTLT